MFSSKKYARVVLMMVMMTGLFLSTTSTEVGLNNANNCRTEFDRQLKKNSKFFLKIDSISVFISMWCKLDDDAKYASLKKELETEFSLIYAIWNELEWWKIIYDRDDGWMNEYKFAGTTDHTKYSQILSQAILSRAFHYYDEKEKKFVNGTGKTIPQNYFFNIFEIQIQMHDEDKNKFRVFGRITSYANSRNFWVIIQGSDGQSFVKTQSYNSVEDYKQKLTEIFTERFQPLYYHSYPENPTICFLYGKYEEIFKDFGLITLLKYDDDDESINEDAFEEADSINASTEVWYDPLVRQDDVDKISESDEDEDFENDDDVNLSTVVLYGDSIETNPEVNIDNDDQ